MAPTLEEAMFFCKLHKDHQQCTGLFNEIWTDEGLCYTFNMLNSNELYHDGLETANKVLKVIIYRFRFSPVFTLLYLQSYTMNLQKIGAQKTDTAKIKVPG